MIVSIPAKNEASDVRSALEAFTVQRTLDGAALDARLFEIVVFCNDCTDDTADVARAFAARDGAPSVRVMEGTLPAATAHVGTARRTLLDLAAARFLGAGRPYGVLASTDADSRVDPYWVAWTLEHMRRADAVAGHVEIHASGRERMLAPLRLLYDRELTYRRLLGELAALEDPQVHDPAPRHAAFVGTSFAVTAQTYRAAGGLPAIARLEDQALARRLDAIDARVRHTYDVRVATSPRRAGRVYGGFATFLDDLAARGDRRQSFAVRSARASIAEVRAMASLRRMYAGRGTAGDVARTRAYFRTSVAALETILARETTFGATFAAAAACGRPRMYEDEPVDSAIAKLQAAITLRSSPSPVLATLASGGD